MTSFVTSLLELSKERLQSLCANLPLMVERFRNPPPVVAVLKLAGVISDQGRLRQGLSLSALDCFIEQAFKPKQLKAVALIINSPGGSPVQSELIAKRIRQLSEEKNIPVMCFVEDVAASGGYWLACSADEIFASRSSIIGSIGVIGGGFGFPEALKKLGVERRIYKQGENKNILDPFLPEKQSDVDLIHALQKDIHEDFKQYVRTRRAGKLKGEESHLFSGEFWTGKRAAELGLIDGIDDMYTLVKARFGEKVIFKRIEQQKSLLKRLKIGAQASVTDQLVESVCTQVEERLWWQRYGQ